MDSILIKFIAVFAIFAVFVSVYAEWSGNGESVAGWDNFTDTVTASPTAWYLSTPQVPMGGAAVGTVYDIYSIVYGREAKYYGDCHTVLWSQSHNVSQETPLTAESVLLHAYNSGTGLYGGDHSRSYQNWFFDMPLDVSEQLAVSKGDWRFETHFNTGPFYGPLRRNTTFGFDVEVWGGFGPDNPGGACSGIGPVMRYSANWTVSTTNWSRDWNNPSLLNHDQNFTVRTIDDYLLHGGDYFQFWVFYDSCRDDLENWCRNTLNLTSTQNKPMKVNLPSITVIDRCTNQGWFCGISQFFSSLFAWIGFVVYSIVWAVEVFFATLVWLIYVTILFFGGLFALGFSDIFGPAGFMVTAFLVVFLAIVIMKLISVVKPTGSTSI